MNPRLVKHAIRSRSADDDLRAKLDALSLKFVADVLRAAERTVVVDSRADEQSSGGRRIAHRTRRLRTLQRAVTWRLQLENGDVRTRAEIAKREGISAAAVTQTLRVLNVYENGHGGLSPMQMLRTRRAMPSSDIRAFRELRKELLQRFEADYVAATLRAASGNISMAARLARIDRKHFWRLLRRTGVK